MTGRKKTGRKKVRDTQKVALRRRQGDAEQKGEVQVEVTDNYEQTAAQKAFNIYELVEQILLQAREMIDDDDISATSLRTILLAQRVNKTFRNVITGSPGIKPSKALQENLFFAPSTSPGVIGRDLSRCNPLLARIRPHSMSDGSILISCGTVLLAQPFIAPSDYSRHSPAVVEESWRKMLVCNTQSKVVADLGHLELRDLSQRAQSCRFKHSCTMGEVWDTLMKENAEFAWLFPRA